MPKTPPWCSESLLPYRFENTAAGFAVGQHQEISPPVPNEEENVGIVFDIQRMSVHDGPGIRTTVFLKGCPFHCLWCHNPEGISSHPQLLYTPSLCMLCGKCVSVCPQGAHVIQGQEHKLVRSVCQVCLTCAAACPTRALEVTGKSLSVAEVMKQVEKDVPFYDESAGGITLSGGEPLYQFSFAYGLVLAAKRRGIHTCMETSGYGKPDQFRALAEVIDLFLFDFKESDPNRCKQFTGVALEQVLESLETLDRLHVPFVLRCIILPEVNLREDHLVAIAKLARTMSSCHGVELLSYHPLGQSKRRRLGYDYEEGCFSSLTHEQQAAIVEFLREMGLERVHWR